MPERGTWRGRAPAARGLGSVGYSKGRRSVIGTRAVGAARSSKGPKMVSEMESKDSSDTTRHDPRREGVGRKLAEKSPRIHRADDSRNAATKARYCWCNSLSARGVEACPSGLGLRLRCSGLGIHLLQESSHRTLPLLLPRSAGRRGPALLPPPRSPAGWGAVTASPGSTWA